MVFCRFCCTLAPQLWRQRLKVGQYPLGGGGATKHAAQPVESRCESVTIASVLTSGIGAGCSRQGSKRHGKWLCPGDRNQHSRRNGSHLGDGTGVCTDRFYD